jgi:hypothetical protein
MGVTALPHVWLTYEELAEFLDCDPESARHKAIESGWPRAFDEAMRFRLPAAAALKYVLLNLRRSGERPRDAVLFEQALEQIEDLKRQVMEAQGTIRALESDLAAERDRTTDLLVSTLNGISAEMRKGEQATDRRSAAA